MDYDNTSRKSHTESTNDPVPLYRLGRFHFSNITQLISFIKQYRINSTQGVQLKVQEMICCSVGCPQPKIPLVSLEMR